MLTISGKDSLGPLTSRVVSDSELDVVSTFRKPFFKISKFRRDKFLN